MPISVLGADRVKANMLRRAAAAQAAASVVADQGADAVEGELRYLAPVLSGTLRDSIGRQEEEAAPGYKAIGVGAGVEYDRYYQLGTSRQPARPYASEAAASAEEGIFGGAARIISGAM